MWGTNFTYEDYIIRKEFKNKFEIEDYIEELQEEITQCELDLIVYAISDPENILELDEERSIVNAVMQTVTSTLEWYKEAVIKLDQVRRYLEVYTE